MVYPEEPSIWAISPSHIPALYDDDGDYGGKKPLSNSLRLLENFHEWKARSKWR
jgi:hypothetical protein